MHPLRVWLFKTVANEVSFRGINGIHLKQLASSAGVNADQVHKYFPDKRALIFSLIDEICAAQKDFILQHFQQAATADERSIQFITSSFEFIEKYPSLAEVFVISLLGSDQEIKEHVHDEYKHVLAIILDDLISEKVIQSASPTIVSDLTVIFLSVIFLGGCPWLNMDYDSFVDPRRIAVSTLSAMKRRYEINRG
ncbi:MAG: TetR/AcrR family transcriptional regulator [Anaerolineaceae bacterium]|nr:TetR/AcrR family transcriptional regulator [Anaerolineaceae bacterium]